MEGIEFSNKGKEKAIDQSSPRETTPNEGYYDDAMRLRLHDRRQQWEGDEYPMATNAPYPVPRESSAEPSMLTADTYPTLPDDQLGSFSAYLYTDFSPQQEGPSSWRVESGSDYPNIDPRLLPTRDPETQPGSSLMRDVPPQQEGYDNKSTQRVAPEEVIDAINADCDKRGVPREGEYVYSLYTRYYRLQHRREWKHTKEEEKKEVTRCRSLWNKHVEKLAEGRNIHHIENRKQRKSADTARATQIRRYAGKKGINLRSREADTPSKALKAFKRAREENHRELSTHAKGRTDDKWETKATNYDSDNYVTTDPEPPAEIKPISRQKKKRR